MTRVLIPSETTEPIRGCLNGEPWAVPVNRQIEIPDCIYKIIKESKRVVRQSAAETKEYADGTKKIN